MPAPTKVKLTGGVFQDAEGNPLAFGYLEMVLSQDGAISGVGQICAGVTIKVLLDGNGSAQGTSGLTLTAAAAGGVYTGTITGGDNNAFVGLTFVVAGFSTSANNGTFVCTASSATQLTLNNSSSSTESHAATATASQAVWGDDQLSPANSYYRVTGFTAAGQVAWGPNNQQVFGNGGTFDVGTWVPNQVISWNPPTSAPQLETNGVLNTMQTRLNLIAGTGITLTADGSGGVTISTP